MKQYELTFLIHPDLEMSIEPVVDKVKSLVEANGGKVTKEANEGKKRLAYTLKGQDYAIYYYLELDLPAQAPERSFTLSSSRCRRTQTQSRGQETRTPSRY